MYAKTVKYLVLVMFICSMIDCISASVVKPSSDVQFIFKNSAETTLGGIRYNDVIGRDYSLLVLDNTTSFVLSILQQKNPNERKNVQRVGLIVADMGNHYYTRDGIITVSERCAIHHPGDLKTELNSFLLREVTHIWQWNGNGSAPTGLVEGIADFVRLKGGHASPQWVKPGQGDRWDQGFDVTARFLDYCNDLNRKGNFVAELNKKMKNGYSDSFFEELLGKNVDTLWADYKAKYAN